MKSTLRYSMIFILMGILILKSCRKEKDNDPPDSFEGDPPLTDEQVAFLDSVQDTIIRAEDIIMSTGQNVLEFLETYDPGFLDKEAQKFFRSGTALTPRLQKETFLARMLLTGVFLVERSLHVHPEEGSDGPAQNGLAYSYGSKDYDIRQSPPHAEEDCKTTKLYGLDCSGMMWVMTQSAGLPPVVPRESFRVATISDAQKWTDAFKSSSDFKDLKMEDKGQISKGDMKNGDIILWGSHAGIYLYGTFFQSNGTSHFPGCQSNTSASRGPREISVDEVLEYGLGSYKVFRVTSGDDYTLTAEIDIKGYSLAGMCVLGDYKERAVINITRKEDNIILNYINNTDPPVSFSSSPLCECLGMSFTSRSMITVTDFTGHIVSPSGYLLFNLLYTFDSATGVYQCGDAPAITFRGEVFTDIQVQDTIWLPREGEAPTNYTFTIWSPGTLTVARD